MNFRVHIPLLLALIIPAATHAQAGKSGLSFLKLGVSGRSLSMGDAMAATVAGAAATFYNPSGVLQTGEHSAAILLTHKEWVQDYRSQFLGASFRLDEESAIGISVNTATVSDILIHTRPGPPEGTFTSRDFVAGVSYARSFSEDLKVGVTAKFLFEKIFVDDAHGFAVDIGAQYATSIDNLHVGAMLANLGSMNVLRNEATKLPSLLRLGPAYVVDLEDATSRVTVASDYVYIFPEKRSYINLGGEWLFDGVVAARTGYQLGSDARGISAGAGVRHGIFRVDYAFAPLSESLGNGHTFSLEIEF